MLKKWQSNETKYLNSEEKINIQKLWFRGSNLRIYCKCMNYKLLCLKQLRKLLGITMSKITVYKSLNMICSSCKLYTVI